MTMQLQNLTMTTKNNQLKGLTMTIDNSYTPHEVLIDGVAYTKVDDTDKGAYDNKGYNTDDYKEIILALRYNMEYLLKQTEVSSKYYKKKGFNVNRIEAEGFLRAVNEILENFDITLEEYELEDLIS